MYDYISQCTLTIHKMENLQCIAFSHIFMQTLSLLRVHQVNSFDSQCLTAKYRHFHCKCSLKILGYEMKPESYWYQNPYILRLKVKISVYSNWQTAFFLFTHQLDIEWHLHKQPYYRLLNKVQTPISFEFWFVLVCQLMMGIQCIYLKLIVENSCQQLQSGCRDWQDWTETVTMCQSNLQENTAEPGDHSQKAPFSLLIQNPSDNIHYIHTDIVNKCI